VWIGAAATALLFDFGKFLIGFYIGKSSVGSMFGAAGSVVVILAWVYYSSQLVFLGAEFSYVLLNTIARAPWVVARTVGRHKSIHVSSPEALARSVSDLWYA